MERATAPGAQAARRAEGADRSHWPARAGRRPGGAPSRTAAAQAARVGDAAAGDVERGAVVGAGAHERQAERHVDAVLDAEVLHRDQPVVVGHRDDEVELARVAGGVAGAHEHRVGRERPAARRCPRRAPPRPPGAMTRISSSPNSPPSPACGLRPATAMRGARLAPARRRARGRCGSSRAPRRRSPRRSPGAATGGSSPARCAARRWPASCAPAAAAPSPAASACSISVWPG